MSEHLSIRLLGCENSTADKFVPGGSVWHVSGEAMEEEGVMLLPNPTQLYDTPMAAFWAEGMGRRVFQGFQVDKREPQLGWQVWHGGSGSADDWRLTDSLFRMAWSIDKRSRLEFETEDGVRYLDLQLLKEPESYVGDMSQGKDPHFQCDATIITKTTTPSPHWRRDAKPVVQDCTGSSGSMTFRIVNDGDVELWPVWTVSSVNAGTKWVLPDWSFGDEEYLRGVADAARTWTTPALLAGEHTKFDSDSSVEFADSNLATNVWGRCKGRLLYPIPPHTQVDVPVAYTNATAGDQCRLTYTVQYTRPWGVTGLRVV